MLPERKIKNGFGCAICLASELATVLWSNLPGHLNRWKIHHLRKKHDNKKT